MENRAYLEMLRPAKERLAGRDPARLAALCGCGWDAAAGELVIPSLGREFRLSWPNLDLRPEQEGWMDLILLHYLDLGDGIPLTGRLLPLGDMPGGAARGGNMDRRVETEARRLLGIAEESRFRAALLSLGAELTETNADLTAVIPFLPRFPLTVKLWFPDDELPGSGRLFADASAPHFLTVEDAVTAAELVWDKLKKRVDSKQ